MARSRWVVHVIAVENENAGALASDIHYLMTHNDFLSEERPLYASKKDGIGSIGQDVAICSNIEGAPEGLSLVVVYCSIQFGHSWRIHHDWVKEISRLHNGWLICGRENSNGLWWVNHVHQDKVRLDGTKCVKTAIVYEPDGDVPAGDEGFSTDSESEDNNPAQMIEQRQFEERLEDEGYIKIYNAPPFVHGRRIRNNIKILVKILPETVNYEESISEQESTDEDESTGDEDSTDDESEDDL